MLRSPRLKSLIISHPRKRIPPSDNSLGWRIELHYLLKLFSVTPFFEHRSYSRYKKVGPIRSRLYRHMSQHNQRDILVKHILLVVSENLCSEK